MLASRANGKANMSLLPQTTSVFVVSPDTQLREAVARLLELDGSLDVVGTSRTSEDPRMHGADVVVDDSLLDEFKTLSIGSFITMVKHVQLERSRSVRHLSSVPNPSDEMRAVLSERELQVVRLVAEGLSNKEISIRMKLSDKTVKNHISHILAKLHLTARTQVAVHALRAGIA
jgi:DNA-binding CsgD family transcriptional regulator